MQELIGYGYMFIFENITFSQKIEIRAEASVDFY